MATTGNGGLGKNDRKTLRLIREKIAKNKKAVDRSIERHRRKEARKANKAKRNKRDTRGDKK